MEILKTSSQILQAYYRCTYGSVVQVVAAGDLTSAIRVGYLHFY